MHGGRGVCQWCARSSPVETRQNPRPRTTTIVIPNIATINSSTSNNKNNDINNVGGRRILSDDDNNDDKGIFVGRSYKNPVTGNNKNIRNISGRRGVTCARRRRRRRRCCYYCRAVLSTAALSRHDAAAGDGWSRAVVERK
ncbi:hypothetical protein ALC60_06895 [Trachymyrmex zeteki]|uniref:Uncharacterized protein n=1 Tax=Mycetomoellerius zeteki TaxID=64791 RepID=A0A151X1V0_9HYME|nr:PREDICTED: uncharacterized protein LOC108723718 [Trachymyrmex zeteki]KYQ54348.1 hypothetical protein ALC60_06895 [Trachymyrmex zeteki]